MRVGFVDVSAFVGGAERELLDHAAAMQNDYGTFALAIIESRNSDLAAMLERSEIRVESADFDLVRNRGVSLASIGNIWRLFRQAKKLRVLARRYDLDLLISYSFHSGVIAAIARLSGMKAKLVVGQLMRRELSRGGWMEQLQFLAADAVTYNSNAMRESFASVARRYGRPEKVVYSYVKRPQPQDERNERERLFAEHGLAPDTKIIGYCGRIFESKRVTDVVEAVALLNATRQGRFFLVVIGASSTPSEYETRVRALAETKCPGRHRFFAFSSNPFPLLAACDVVVQPSIEPFGRVLVEAMYLGVPFVATNLGGPKEIVGFADPRCGKLVPLMRPDLIAAAVNELTNNRPAEPPPVPHPLTREGIVGGAVQFYQDVLGGRSPARSETLGSGLQAAKGAQ